MGDLEGDYLLVDIAGYKLFLVQDDVVTWSSAIQVGKPYRQTPVLTSRITYLEWNPGWVVPPTIATEDVVPAIKRDPSYLQRHHMELVYLRRQTRRPGKRQLGSLPGTATTIYDQAATGPLECTGHREIYLSQQAPRLPARHAQQKTLWALESCFQFRLYQGRAALCPG